jgi:hypothetical protein
MQTYRLELRSPPVVVAAYLLAAIAGGLMFELEFRILDVMQVGTPIQAIHRSLQSAVETVLLTGVPLLAIEIVALTPILIGFARRRWRWLNGWTGVLMGALLGAVPSFLFFLRPNADGTSESLGLYQNGGLTLAGWAHAGNNAILFGAVGATAALIFRVVAVRRYRELSDRGQAR